MKWLRLIIQHRFISAVMARRATVRSIPTTHQHTARGSATGLVREKTARGAARGILIKCDVLSGYSQEVEKEVEGGGTLPPH
jgi:hypothetical protein